MNQSLMDDQTKYYIPLEKSALLLVIDRVSLTELFLFWLIREVKLEDDTVSSQVVT